MAGERKRQFPPTPEFLYAVGAGWHERSLDERMIAEEHLRWLAHGGRTERDFSEAPITRFLRERTPLKQGPAYGPAHGSWKQRRRRRDGLPTGSRPRPLK